LLRQAIDAETRIDEVGCVAARRDHHGDVATSFGRCWRMEGCKPNQEGESAGSLRESFHRLILSG
jgi:hypothetical protein